MQQQSPGDDGHGLATSVTYGVCKVKKRETDRGKQTEVRKGGYELQDSLA